MIADLLDGLADADSLILGQRHQNHLTVAFGIIPNATPVGSAAIGHLLDRRKHFITGGNDQRRHILVLGDDLANAKEPAAVKGNGNDEQIDTRGKNQSPKYCQSKPLAL